MTVRTISSFAVAMLLALAAIAAGASYVQNESGIESSSSDVRLPDSDKGFMVVKSCADCEETTVRVTESTVCVANNQAVPCKQFREYASVNGRELMIFFDTETRVVNRLVINGNFKVEPLTYSKKTSQGRRNNRDETDTRH